MDGQQLLHIATSKLFSHSWPITIGSGVAYLVTEFTAWTHPAVVAVLSGALVQVFIALMRNWFAERRELLSTMQDMLREQRQHVHDMLQSEKDERHSLANRASQAEMKIYLLSQGVPFDELPNIPPLYKKADQDGGDQSPT